MSSVPPNISLESVAEDMTVGLSKLEEDLKQGEDTTMIQGELRGLGRIVKSNMGNSDGESLGK